jgi:UDP-N-acetylmuramoyl-tripeptide--D-alanyl-D-alanine ligase
MSVRFDVAALMRWVGGRLDRGTPGARLSGVSTDTRANLDDLLFVAIRGPHHDAHAYLSDAIAGGAGALLVESVDAVPADARLPVLEVPDTTLALGAAAAGHRRGFKGPLVAITGSNGKTTTKEMCAAILSIGGPTHKNRGNLNNAYGLPLTLLAREPEHRAMVVEIGMNHRGEIAPLAKIAAPTVGVITNAGTAHIEHLGSREEIALEKGDLIAALGADARAVINADDALVVAQATRTQAQVVTFGIDEPADVWADQIVDHGGRFSFGLHAPEGETGIEIAGLGAPTVSNALAAAAAALAAGAAIGDLAPGLAAYQPEAGRMVKRVLANGTTVIDDTYNANPQSMRVALDSLAHNAGAGRGVAVVGDMGELGVHTDEGHRATGTRVAELGIGGIVALGSHAQQVIDAAQAGGFDAARTHAARDHDDAALAASTLAGDADWILVKGSRAMRMEQVVERLVRSGEEA